MPIIEKLKTDKEKMDAASCFAVLYLWNERLREARQANEFWLRLTRKWVDEHPFEAKNALAVCSDSSIWYPHGVSFLDRPDTARIRGFSDVIEGGQVLSKIPPENREMIVQWRDSRLMGEFVDWIAGRYLIGEPIWAIAPTHDYLSPSTPTGYEPINFPRLFIAHAGVPRREFQRMWTKATTLEI